MTCSTRESTRWVLSPVKDTLGTTSGSVCSNFAGVFSSGLPRTDAIADAHGWNLQASFSSTSTRTCKRSSFPSSINGGLSGCEDRLINRHIKASVVQLLDADRNPWAHAFADPESVLYFCQVGLGLFDLGERRLDLGLEIATIHFKEWISRAHSISP